MSCFRGPAQQGLQGLPVETLDAVAAHLSTKEKISLACSCKALWAVGSSSTSWWHTLALDPAADTILELASWWPQRKLVLQLQLSSGNCRIEAAASFLQALAGGSLLSLNWDMGGSLGYKQYDLVEGSLRQLPALKSLELSCDAPDWESLFGPPEDLGEGTPLYLSPAFSQLTALTSFKASCFSSLNWPPGCLPPGLRSLSVYIHRPPDVGPGGDAEYTVEYVGRGASSVSALQSLSIEVEELAAHQQGPDWPTDIGWLELSALRDPWSQQLTELNLFGHGRAMDLAYLAGLSNLQQLRLGAGDLRRDWGMAEEEEAEEAWWQQQPPQPLAPLAALTQLRSVRLERMNLWEAEKLQPVWSLPLLQKLDLASLCGLRRSLSSLFTLDSCKAQHLVVSYQLAAALGPMLGPLAQLEQLTIAGIESCNGHPLHFSPEVVEELISHCPRLRMLECVIYDSGKAPSVDQRQALSAVLPVRVKLALRMAGAAFFYPKACDRNAYAPSGGDEAFIWLA